MKHLKTYKLFKENINPYSPSEIDEICEDIKEILIGLVDDQIEVNVDSFQEGGQYIDIRIESDGELGDSFEKYEAEFKHLFSYMYTMDWQILPLRQKTFYSYYSVNDGDPDVRCPKCGSFEIYDNYDGQDLTCDDCGHKDDRNDFISYDYKFETPDELINLLDKDCDGIRIIFKMQ